MMVERLFLAVSRGCLRFVIVVFPDHTHLLFLITCPRWSPCPYIIKKTLKIIFSKTKRPMTLTLGMEYQGTQINDDIGQTLASVTIRSTSVPFDFV